MGNSDRTAAGGPSRSARDTGDPGILSASLVRDDASSPLGRARATVELARSGRGSEAYPDGLRALHDAPERLYVRGGALPATARAVAIVGARAATPYGRDVAARLAGDLARLGLVVVSGLARGIDAAAHEGALAADGATVAVLPGGLDHVTPAHHRALAARIAERGALVSERASGPPGARWAFPRRNRLIAALAGATVVVEAAESSGSLSTAAVCRRIGRPLLAVPADIDRPGARGTLALLRAGARVCTGAADVLDALRESAGPGSGASPETPSARLLAALDARPVTLDDLSVRAGVAALDALPLLLQLEWSGAAVACPGGRWRGGGERPA